MRVFSQRVYGIPPEQVVGSSILTKYEYAEANRIDARAQSLLHRRQGGQARGDQSVHRQAAIAAFGNSNGDAEMLEWTQAGDGAAR